MRLSLIDLLILVVVTIIIKRTLFVKVLRSSLQIIFKIFKEKYKCNNLEVSIKYTLKLI